MKKTNSKRRIITDKLVVDKTSKTMADWFLYLDKLGAKKMKKPEIFKLVSSTPGLQQLGEWNQNLLTTAYEWDRGLSERGQKGNAFEVSVSKTVSASLPVLFSFFSEERLRKKWLTKKIVIRKMTENKSARITWSDQKTSLSVDFYPKGAGKSQVVVQHQKIPDREMAAELRVF